MDGDIPANGGYNPELPGKTWALNTAEKPLLWVPAMCPREKNCPFSLVEFQMYQICSNLGMCGGLKTCNVFQRKSF